MSFAAAFFNFSVDLSNADRGVYARFRVKVPQHPLESLEHLYARELAYCHCYREGQLFSGGMFEPKDPTIWQKEITGELLREAHHHGLLNFQGNVEGNDIFKGTTDLVVCDGFVGNVALKTSEGLAAMVGHFLKQAFSQNLLTRLVALIAMPVLKDFKDRMDHRRHNGAALLGLNGLVFKSHGSADAVAFGTALDRAYDAAKHGLLLQVQQRLEQAAPLIAAFNARSMVTSSSAS